MTEGITHFLIVDGSGKALSERLIFTTDKQAPGWQIKTDKEAYGKREKVSMQLKATDAAGLSLSGSFSVSITSHRDILTDSLTDNILSNLLLTSDLKGTIENPGYYFLKQDAKTRRYQDLVMLTHGWRRHRIENVFRLPVIRMENYMEAGQTISGRIKGLFGNIKKGPIYVLAPKRNIMETTMTNEEGEFIVNTSFRDSTTFVIQARTKKGFAGVDILVDNPPLPAACNPYPYPQVSPVRMDDYLINTREKYYMEGGMRVYNLKEVVVTAARHPASEQSVYVGISDYTIDGDKLVSRGSQAIMQAIMQLPGVRITNGNEIHIRNNPQQPVLVIGNMVYEEPDYTMLDMLQTDDVASLSLVRDAGASLFGSMGSGGAIVITLKDPRTLPKAPARGIITYTPLGYSPSVEFYHPAYDTPQKKESTTADLRTTIYWNPELRLDANGTATIEYYMPDSTAPQDITIEGVDKNGKVCRFTKTIHQSSD